MNWDELKNAPLDAILAWAEEQPFARAMAVCAQDSLWHAEGDVWMHTRMVCEQLTHLEEWPALPASERIILIFTALLHDAAKPLTVQVDPQSGRITTPKHAVRGERLSRCLLRDVGCDLVTREEIARLVRYHGRPAFALTRAQPENEVASLSWLANVRLLYLFALADSRGRTTHEMTRPEENLHLFRMLAEELDCYDRRYAFASDQARVEFFRQAEPNRHYVPHFEERCVVTLIAGIPGAGKDRWLQTQMPGVPMVSLDQLRDEMGVSAVENQGQVAQAARERCREFLRAGVSFAFNATNLLRQTRRRWLDLFYDYGARMEIVYLEPPLQQILTQNRQRPDSVPESVVCALAEKVEPPTWDEAHSLLLQDRTAVVPEHA